MDEHYRALERMYLHGAQTNRAYTDLDIQIGDRTAEVSITVTPDLHHAAGAMHGSHTFKLLDDAAFFAVNSMVTDVFVLTAQMSIQLMRPVVAGRITARGKVVKPGRNTFFASAELVGADGKVLAVGQGTFNRSTIRLLDTESYVG